MRSLAKLSIAGALLLVCIAGPASAQIMRITTDNPDNNTVLKPSGTTLLTITLDPSISVDGPAFCNWSVCPGGPGENCWDWAGGPPCAWWQSLQVTGYRIILTAVGGTVTWGSFTPADPSWKGGSPPATSTQVEIDYSQYPSASGGLFTVGTIPVTPSSAFTHIEIARASPTSYGTWLEMKDCYNPLLPGYPYILGDRSNPCQRVNWFDAFGAISAMDGCLAQANHGQCVTCCKDAGGTANTCAKFCNQIKGGAGEPPDPAPTTAPT